MSVMVRVEKFKNLQNKACLPSFLCYLLCPGYFGSDFLAFSLWDNLFLVDSIPERKKKALFCKFLNFSTFP